MANSFLLGKGVLSRTQTCMDAGLCCRHGGRGGEVITGPGGLLGTCSCQLCTNSPTSSVTFPAGKTSIMMRWAGSRAEGSEAEAGDKGEPFGRSQSPALPPYAGFPTEPVSWKSRLIRRDMNVLCLYCLTAVPRSTEAAWYSEQAPTPISALVSPPAEKKTKPQEGDCQEL